jgi:hypothetical protein
MAKTNLLYFPSLLVIKNFQKHFIYVKFKFFSSWLNFANKNRAGTTPYQDSENKEEKKGQI